MSHKFGNIDSWTTDKLTRVDEYLRAYIKVMKNQPFSIEYIDAFAGNGSITRKVNVSGETLFDSDESIHFKDVIDGSARLALQTEPPFAKYTFIEKHKGRSQELEQLKREFPHLAGSINVIRGDANSEVQKLCSVDWLAEYRRAVMFLDPYGAQVTWQTIEAIAATKAIDLWILFPISTVNRLLNRDGNIRDARRRRLDLLFGETSWFDAFFHSESRPALFDKQQNNPHQKKTEPFREISSYFLKKLRTIFADVADNPLMMKNSSNSPIFLLCFAAGNPKGAPIAVKIAGHILGKK